MSFRSGACSWAGVSAALRLVAVGGGMSDASAYWQWTSVGPTPSARCESAFQAMFSDGLMALSPGRLVRLSTVLDCGLSGAIILLFCLRSVGRPPFILPRAYCRSSCTALRQLGLQQAPLVSLTVSMQDAGGKPVGYHSHVCHTSPTLRCCRQQASRLSVPCSNADG